MNTLTITFLAASLAALANLFYRKNGEKQAAPGAYLVCYYFVSFLACFVIYPHLLIRHFNPTVAFFGALVGILNVGVMWLTAKAFQKGPAGMTYAFQNGSSVFPNLILFFIFGSAYGFVVTLPQLAGMGLVLLGLYLAAGPVKGVSRGWLEFVVACLVVQTAALTLMQWRCLLYTPHENGHTLIPASFSSQDDCWFMPALFLSALIFQLLLFYREKRWIESTELLFGTAGGTINAVSTALLLVATRTAAPIEKGVIFPLFAVAVIVLCNLWGYKLYNEKIHVKANLLCASGILVASLL